MARLHNFTDEAICAIMTRHGQERRYGVSRKNREAVALISRQNEIDANAQTDALAAALLEAAPILADAYATALRLRADLGLNRASTDGAVNALKRARR